MTGKVLPAEILDVPVGMSSCLVGMTLDLKIMKPATVKIIIISWPIEVL